MTADAMEFRIRQINKTTSNYKDCAENRDFDGCRTAAEDFMRLIAEWTPLEAAQMKFAKRLGEDFDFMINFLCESWGWEIHWAGLDIADPSELEDMEQAGIDIYIPNDITPNKKLKHHKLRDIPDAMNFVW